MEVGGGNHEEWDIIRKNRHKKKEKNKSDYSDCDGRAAVVKRRREDHKVIFKLESKTAT